MPSRFEPFIDKELYHLFSQSIDGKRIFEDDFYCKEFYNRLLYYRSSNATKSYSHLNLISKENYDEIYKEVMLKDSFKISILNYSLMPTHFHLITKQLKDNGITDVLSKTLNSFTRFYNSINNRKGQIFLSDFKAVRITSDEQLMHDSRYLDLNSYSAGLIKDFNKLPDFKWSGYPAYLGMKEDPLIDKSLILGMFGNDIEKYKEFVQDRADYQKSLESIKHSLKLI